LDLLGREEGFGNGVGHGNKGYAIPRGSSFRYVTISYATVMP